MILSVRRTDYGALRESLKKEQKIVVLSCNNCAKKCNLGGRVGLKALADKLEADGFQVIRRELVGFGCSVDLLMKRGKEESTRQWFQDADVIIPLACEDGEHAARVAFPGKTIPKVNKTLGMGWVSPSTGAHLTHCLAGIQLEIDSRKGMPLADAAKALGLEAGPF